MSSILHRVHERLGGLGVDIQTFGENGPDCVEIRWRRDYGKGYGWSDERWSSAGSITGALRKVLAHEAVDEAEATEHA